MTEISETNLGGDFDHAPLARLRTYGALRQALDAFVVELRRAADAGTGPEMTGEEVLAAVREMALSSSFADACERCHTLMYPYAGDGGRYSYRCPSCRVEATCAYGSDLFSSAGRS